NVLSSALLFALRGHIISQAARLDLPAMYQWPETAEEGGLIAYGPSLRGAFRQVTTLVDKVLKGAKPGDIPVEQPTRFSLVINLKAASALGLTVPPLTVPRGGRHDECVVARCRLSGVGGTCRLAFKMPAFGPGEHSGEPLPTAAKPAYLELIFRPVIREKQMAAQKKWQLSG